VKTISSLRMDLSDAAVGNLSRSDFVFGVATAAYQIEGAAREGGRGASIWDTFSHTPGKTRNGDTGDVACDHYHRWQEDLDLMASLGVDAYRFSVAWPRVQPLGEGAWNEAGLGFYDRLVDGLLARGIQPHVTLYHWDLPQALQDQGGWARRETVYDFARYAEKMAVLLGDRVASIATHNEPWCTAQLGHATGQFAPGLRDEAVAVQVAHHLLLSHGLALRAIRGADVRAPLGIVLNQAPSHPASDSEADRQEATRQYARYVRWYMDPLFLGRYPEEAAFAKMPQVQPGDMEIINTPLDLLGLNYYTRSWISAAQPPVPPPASLGVTDMGWEIYPQGLAEHLLALHRSYRLPPIYITENGMAEADVLIDGQVNDPRRIDYVARHLEAVVDARAAGVNVRGYFYWSLLDNFEWDSGYLRRFGLVHVDYATQRRTLKASAKAYRDLLRQVGQHREAQGRG
jgi:beta-glucosidase